MGNINNEPKFLAVVTLTNKSKPEELANYQGMLTKMSESQHLKNIILTIPSKVNNRGLNAGQYPLVDVLKTLGSGVTLDMAKKEEQAVSMAEELTSGVELKDANVSVFSKMLEIEDMHSASIKIESNKNSAFTKGYYLLRPLLEVLHRAILDIPEQVANSK